MKDATAEMILKLMKDQRFFYFICLSSILIWLRTMTAPEMIFIFVALYLAALTIGPRLRAYGTGDLVGSFDGFIGLTTFILPWVSIVIAMALGLFIDYLGLMPLSKVWFIAIAALVAWLIVALFFKCADQVSSVFTNRVKRNH